MCCWETIIIHFVHVCNALIDIMSVMLHDCLPPMSVLLYDLKIMDNNPTEFNMDQ